MTNALRAPVQEEWPPAVKTFSLSSKLVYRDEDRRFDPTTYSQDYYAALQMIEQCRFPKTELRTLVGRVYHPTQNQARSNFKRIWVKRGEGVPFLTGRQLFFFRPDKEKFLSPKMEKFHELIVPKGTILLSRSGTTGYPVLVGGSLSGFAVTDDAIRIFRGQEPIGFVYAFLASRVGRALLTKNEYGSTVSHLEAKHVSALPVPLVPSTARESIHQKVVRAYALRDDANAALDQADAELHITIGVSRFDENDIHYLGQGSDARVFTTPSSDLNERLDATQHVPVVRSVLWKIERGRFRLARLHEMVSRITIPARFKRVYVEADRGVPYILPSHLPTIRFYGLKRLAEGQAKSSPEYLLREGELMLTVDGTIGRLHPVTKRMAGWFGSNNIARLWDTSTDLGFLYAYLSTPYGQNQLTKDAYGGVVDHITESHIKSLHVPAVPRGLQIRIGELVREAFDLKDAANELEDEAVSELEALIGAR
jgi:type I restriction enzyme S subunit